jgi:rRNA maturation endonuclease Nob1
MTKECIECYRTFNTTDNDYDVCDFCNGNLRRR